MNGSLLGGGCNLTLIRPRLRLVSSHHLIYWLPIPFCTSGELLTARAVADDGGIAHLVVLSERVFTAHKRGTVKRGTLEKLLNLGVAAAKRENPQCVTSPREGAVPSKSASMRPGSKDREGLFLRSFSWPAALPRSHPSLVRMLHNLSSPAVGEGSVSGNTTGRRRNRCS